MKKVLSANATASVSVESLMNDVDVRGSLTRDAFEQMSAPLLQRVRKPLEQVCVCVRVCVGALAAGVGEGSSREVLVVVRVEHGKGGGEGFRWKASLCVSMGYKSTASV